MLFEHIHIADQWFQIDYPRHPFFISGVSTPANLNAYEPKTFFE